MPRAFIRSVSPSMLVCHGRKSGSPSVQLRDSGQQTERPGDLSAATGGALSPTQPGATVPIRRALSLDAIYLLGQWPRERLTAPSAGAAGAGADKATQTPDEWVPLRSHTSPLAWGSGLVSPVGSGPGTADCLEKKLIRQRLQRNTKELSSARGWGPGAVRQSPVPADHSLLVPTGAARPITIPTSAAGRPPTTPPRSRSSVEGLNQEIERLVQQRVLAFSQCPVDGHLAPVDELLLRSRRSVNTQTPLDDQLLSPTFSGDMEALGLADDISKSSTPDLELSRLGSSPQINRFLARAPPDGCERVCLKTVETVRKSTPPDPIIKPAVFELKPSLGSAFTRPAFRKRADDASGSVPTPTKPALLKAPPVPL
ncbi:protein FAM117B-like [Amphibalanus amphitrite]|uniref:protein FAM117B-like n=1 Tax=Amphibalanus amphitrite TaxID=1232801 RepID=UPI001C91601E|nr:protein FAM117B-like [Amphibalanus amphitrite]XP_043208133.1 protein FAM117B-like [Amphibalanus amphitrite]XP_043235584.1 protein FAM117B-like [Amphibalanus amphitrite]